MAANLAAIAVEPRLLVKPEFVSVAVVYVPGLLGEKAAADDLDGVESWALHAGGTIGTNVPEAMDAAPIQPARETLLQSFCRIAALWPR
jgi:hypothetical protein